MAACVVDSDRTGEFVCLGGPHFLSIVKAYKLSAVKRFPTTFHELHLLRWQTGSDRTQTYIGVASLADVYIYQFENGGLKEVTHFRAQSHVISDLDWSFANSGYLATCSMKDVVKIWDTRVGPLPSLQLKSVAGAEQAKWSPHQDSVLCTASGGDIRLWDIRQPSLPFHMIEAHVERVKCLAWHPKEPSTFVSSGVDRYVKFWHASDLSKPFRSVGQLEEPVSKIQFSYNGDELATLSKRGFLKGSLPNIVTVFKTNNLMRCRALKNKGDDVVDICWQGAIRKRTTDCLFSVSKSGHLRRFEITTLSVADTKVPLAASEDDDDLRAAESAFKYEFMGGLTAARTLSQHERKILYGSEGHGYKTYVRVPNVGNSIGTELDSLSALKAPGLSIDEINYERVVVVLTYRHAVSGKRIRFSMRFQASNAKFHKLLVEIYEDESDVDESQASGLLEMLRARIAGHKSDASEDTAIACGFKELQNFVDTLKIFEIEGGANGDASVEETDRPLSRTEIMASPELGRRREEFIPSPRTCGASFNGSGMLVVFGRAGKSKENASPRHSIRPSSAASSKTPEYYPIREGAIEIVELPLSEASSQDDLSVSGRLSREGVIFSGRSPQDDVDAPSAVPRTADYCWHPLSEGVLQTEYSGSRPGSRDTLSFSEQRHSPFGEDIGVFRMSSSDLSCAEVRSPPRSISGTSRRQTPDSSASRPSHGTQRTLAERPVDVSSKVLLNAPVMIVRSQHHTSDKYTGLLADEHYVIADAQVVSTVVVYDASELLPVSKVLARQYRLLGGSQLQICLHNMRIVEMARRGDLLKFWKIVALWVQTAIDRLARPQLSSKSLAGRGMFIPFRDEDFWAYHPCGAQLLEDILDHCEIVGDYQTAAVVLCTIAPRFFSEIEVASEGPMLRSQRPDIRQVASIPVTVYPSPTSLSSASRERSDPELRKVIAKKSVPKFDSETQKKTSASRSSSAMPALSTSAPAAVITQSPPRKFSLFGFGRRQRAPPGDVSLTLQVSSPSSEGPSVATVPGVRSESPVVPQEEERAEAKSTTNEVPKSDPARENPLYSMITPAVRVRMMKFLNAYAEMLYRWRIYTKAAELLKFTENAAHSRPLAITYDGKCCGRGCGRINCVPPRPPFYCVVCHIVVKGLLTTCIACKHGGHVEHLALWFKDNIQCPSGCRCQCTKFR